MPKLIRLYITQVLTGFGISAAFVAILLYFNVANMWHLVTASDKGVLAVVLLWVSHGIVFAGVQFAIAIMSMKEDGGGGGRRKPEPIRPARLIPVPQEAPQKKNDL